MLSRRHSEGRPRTARYQSISLAPLRQSKTNTSKSLLWKITRNVFHSSSKKTSSSTSPCSQNRTSKPQPESLLFRLPLELREEIYWDVIGRHEVIHILLKHRPARSPAAIAHRRCRARGKVASCMTGKCKELMILDGEYFGWFDRRETGLLYTCRDLWVSCPLRFSFFGSLVVPNSLADTRKPAQSSTDTILLILTVPSRSSSSLAQSPHIISTASNP